MIYYIIFAIIITLIFYIYVRFSRKINQTFQIIETPSSKLSQDILYEKLPILLNDPISNLKQFIKIAFHQEYSTIAKRTQKAINGFVNINGASYLIIQNTARLPKKSQQKENNEEPEPELSIIDVYIAHPSSKNNFKKFFKTNTINYKVNNIDNINNTQFITLHLLPQQILIIPKYWLYFVNSKKNVNSIGLYTILDKFGL